MDSSQHTEASSLTRNLRCPLSKTVKRWRQPS